MNITPIILLKALADETRLRCLALIAAEGELCVCELTHALGIAQPKVSRHLGLLRTAGIVRDRREGLWIHYRLHPDLPSWAQTILHECLVGMADSEPYAADRRALVTMPDRPGTVCCA